MNFVYRATGVTNSKVCHHRTAALQHGGFESLGPHQVNTLTKHKLEKQNSAYGPVAERKTLEIMAGFKKMSPIIWSEALLICRTLFLGMKNAYLATK